MIDFSKGAKLNYAKLKVLILGADGYLGSATLKNFKEKYETVGIDSLFKRDIEEEFDIKPLWPRKNFEGEEIDITNSFELKELLRKVKPDVIIHYAEQPSAPYSMIDSWRSVQTQSNNILGTLGLLWAIKEIVPKCHLIKLGTMGEYGTPNIDIEEGWLDIEHKGRKDRLLFPKKPGSWYHASKVCDSVNIEMACRIWGLKATDLNQGVVYGISDNFHYDEIFGTVLNRFIAQTVIDEPLTVYGKGGQTRGYLNIKDTIQCVELAMINPPKSGEFRVFNQFTEVFSVLDLAEKVSKLTGAKIRNYTNPRVEDEEHYYNPTLSNLPELGLKPHLLTDEVLKDMISTIQNYTKNIDITKIEPKTKWK